MVQSECESQGAECDGYGWLGMDEGEIPTAIDTMTHCILVPFF